MSKTKNTEKKQNVLITPPGRIAFPQVFKAKAFAEGQTENFSLIAIFHPNDFSDAETVQYKAMVKACNNASVKTFGKKMKALPASASRPLSNSEEKAELAGFVPGSVFATLKSKYKPSIVDKHGVLIEDEDDVYAGVWARFTVSPYAYSNSFGKGVKLGLRNIQILKDDERLDGRTDGAQDFDGVAMDDRFLEDEDDVFERDDDEDDSDDEDDDE